MSSMPFTGYQNIWTDPMGGFFGVGREVFFWESLLFLETVKGLLGCPLEVAGKRLGSVVGITPTYPTCK